ncbi:hypothetical protein ED733_005251 [Metarhizium rileyi]|uniref:Pyruvate formate lyase activating enzyme n=1 Tax=Metarhizium rileyi (strain RCEF 4871) TaxID=1649241 RepID=A0A5C6GG29_METRR|nr:hypothetical protein ED733_005251 [Metarhizium rileyi]
MPRLACPSPNIAIEQQPNFPSYCLEKATNGEHGRAASNNDNSVDIPLLCAHDERKACEHIYISDQTITTACDKSGPALLTRGLHPPDYQTLSSRNEAKKRSLAYAHLRKCNLCPRLCGVNRHEQTGMCLIGHKFKVNVIAPHFGEEPRIQGHNGSGAVFMSDAICSVFSARTLTSPISGMAWISPQRNLRSGHQAAGSGKNVHNINIVTPEHVWEASTSKRPLKTANYAATARESIKAMQAPVGDLCFTADGIAKRDLLIRHLVMLGRDAEGAEIMKWLASEVSKDCYINIMEQYRPEAYVGKKKRKLNDRDKDEILYGESNRAVTGGEVSAARQAAYESGLWRFNDPPKHDGFAI